LGPLSLPVALPISLGTVGLRYKPTWLPAGFTERSRSVPLGPGAGFDGPVRYWKGTAQRDSQLQFGAVDTENGADPFNDIGQAVDINGRPGWLGSGKGVGPRMSLVHWMIDSKTVIFIRNLNAGVSDDDLLRMARSVQPDPGQVAVPMRLGWLPTGMASDEASFTGDSPERWELNITTSGPKPPGTPPTPGKEIDERWLFVRLGPTTDAPDGGETITVAGRPARLVVRPTAVPGTEDNFVVVELASGLKLTVFAVLPNFSREDLIATAAAVEVGKTIPDLSWMGVTTR
jgi:hypothetical protein